MRSETVLLGPQRFLTTAGTVVRSVAPEGPVATVTAGWEDRESADGELDEVMEGRSRNLHLYGRLSDVLVSDEHFATEALAHRDAMDELAGLYSLRLQRALDSVYAVARRPARPAVAEAAFADAVRGVRDIDDWYLRTVDQLYGELEAAASPEDSEPIARHRHEVAELLRDAAVVAIAGGHVGILLRCLRLFAVGPRPELPVVAWSAGRDGDDRARRALQRPRPAGGAGRRGLGPRDRTGARRGRDAARPAPAPPRRRRAREGVRPPLRAGRLPAARRRHPGRDRRRRVRARGCSRADGDRGRHLMSRAASKLAINRLLDRKPLDGAAIDRFIERHGAPIIEGSRATFLWRGHADEVSVRHRVVGLPDPLRLRHVKDTDLWYVSTDIPEGSRIEYSFEITRDDHTESFLNDPLNPKLAHGPFGASSVCAAAGYQVPDWTLHDPEARPGEVIERSIASKALRRQVGYHLYLPARFRPVVRYPLIVVHDGLDYLNYTSAKTVLDNLIHRNEIAEMVVAFVSPVGDRLVEYANHAPHARFVARELVPELTAELPLVDSPVGRTLMGSSFGGVASVSTAARYPDVFGSLLLESPSLVFTDIGQDHGGGPVFDPVVKFVNRYRARPRRIADRIYLTCGMYEPLITPNRSMETVFRQAGMEVRYVEARDGHNWENWRDRLRDGLAWLHPGDQKFVYE